MKKQLAVFGLLALAGSSALATTPPWSDGFESYSTGTLTGGGWTPVSGYFVVSTADSPHGGSKHVAMTTGAFGDWNGSAWTNSNAVYVDNDVSYAPSGSDPFLVTYTGWVKILGAGTNTRPVASGFELLNGAGGTIAQAWITAAGEFGILAVYDTDPLNFGETYISSGANIDETAYHKLTIKCDLKHGLTRFELDDSLLHVSGNLKPAIGGTSLIANALPKASPASQATLTAYYDDVSVTASAACPGDLNLDGVVDEDDHTLFDEQYSIFDCAEAVAPLFCSADLNFDGYVDQDDWVIFSYYNVYGCP